MRLASFTQKHIYRSTPVIEYSRVSFIIMVVFYPIMLNCIDTGSNSDGHLDGVNFETSMNSAAGKLSGHVFGAHTDTFPWGMCLDVELTRKCFSILNLV